MFMAGRRPVAGMLALDEDARAMGTRPSWLTHVGTPSVDDTVRLATTLGANVLKPATDIPTAGRFAVLQDPQGAVFAVYTPIEDYSTEAEPERGEFSWHELSTTDWASALQFYRRLFGWEPTTSMDMGPELGTYQMYGRNGRTLGGMFKPPQMQGPPFWLPYIRVTDSTAASVIARKLGGQIINGPMEVPGGDWIAVGMDPQSAVFAVHSLKPVRLRRRVTKRPTRKSSAKTTVRKGRTRRAPRKRAQKGKAAAAHRSRSVARSRARGRRRS
jgi:predicted enzyme related to lactoylglutathione lyase